MKITTNKNTIYNYEPFTPYVVTTQYIENYADDKAENYWKFKGGQTYLVYNCNKMADAVSYIDDMFTSNSRAYKVFPVKWQTLDEYVDDLKKSNEDEEYLRYILDGIRVVSPEKTRHSIEEKTHDGKTYHEIHPKDTYLYLMLDIKYKEENV
tara:strand:+ start:350 stop:805 length:456 start_codon:yes stop_codon:yes gene_type:complete